MIFEQLNEKKKFILHKISSVADSMQIPTYAIGGFVRDAILKRPNKDIDIVCLGNGIDVAHAVAQQLSPIPEVHFFKNFGTAHFIFQDIAIEFVEARKESYASDSRKPSVEIGTLEEDQNRRDFTINAMSMSLLKNNFGAILDPFNGLDDLEKGILKTPLAPEQTFSDDPLRMMRAIRFAAQLKFSIEPHTWLGLKEQASRICIVSEERIMDEFHKILLSNKPSIGLHLLSESGLLQFILPELEALRGVEDVNGIKHKDNFHHTLQVVDNTSLRSENLWLRWAALLHDIGKARTKKFEQGRGWTFHGHEIVSSRMARKIFQRQRMPTNEKMNFVQKIISLHHRPIGLAKEEITDSALRRLLFDAGDDLEQLMMLCESDITSKNANKISLILNNFQYVRTRLKELEEKDHIRNWKNPITGELIMHVFNLPPSKIVGDLKDQIKDAIFDGAIPNEYEAAYNYLLQLGKQKELTLRSEH